MIGKDKEKYVGSDKERADVKAFYQKHKGDMSQIRQYITHVNGPDDLWTVKVIVDSLISAGEIEVPDHEI